MLYYARFRQAGRRCVPTSERCGYVSDEQDFFFDESEPAPKEQATKKASTAKPAAKQAAPAPAGEQMVTMTITVLSGVVALLIGVIIGIFIGRGMAAPVGVTGTGMGVGGATGIQQAPQLTPEQLQNSELPPGHPDIGGMTGGGSKPATGEAGGAGSKETTGK